MASRWLQLRPRRLLPRGPPAGPAAVLAQAAFGSGEFFLSDRSGVMPGVEGHGRDTGRATAALKDGALLTWGTPDFEGGLVNIVQVGLGTNKIFVFDVACDAHQTHPQMAWLLESVSNRSKSLRGVGVEPVPEHIQSLQPVLAQLPHVALVQAAMSNRHREDVVDVYGISPDVHDDKSLRHLCGKKRKLFHEQVEYLRNMSCVGQPHRYFQQVRDFVKQNCGGIELDVKPTKARALTFGDLARLLRFAGTELLVIDAEGYDCRILDSMIDYCKGVDSLNNNNNVWPDVVCFETQGHCDAIDGPSTEEKTVTRLKMHGYCTVLTGHDTVMVRDEAALTVVRRSRLERWLDGVQCEQCWSRARDGMPFACISGVGTTCDNCSKVYRVFGRAAWDDWKQLSCEVKLYSIVSDGFSLWGVSDEQVVYVFDDEHGYWKECVKDMCQISVVSSSYQGYPELWGVDSMGQLLRCSCSSGRWVKKVINSLGQNFLSICFDGETFWAINFHNQILSLAAGAEEGSWEVMSGALTQVSVSDGGGHLWGVNNAGDIYIYMHILLRAGVVLWNG